MLCSTMPILFFRWCNVLQQIYTKVWPKVLYTGDGNNIHASHFPSHLRPFSLTSMVLTTGGLKDRSQKAGGRTVQLHLKKPFTNWSVWLGQTKELPPTNQT